MEPLHSLIARYASFGLHRTGWPADDATSQWIAGWLRERGIDARTSGFRFPMVTSRMAAVVAGDTRIAGTPLHDAGATGPEGIEGRLGIFEEPAPQVLEQWLDSESQAMRTLGAIVVTGDPEGDVVLRNAERINAPWAQPVLQIARRDAARLLQPGQTAGALRLIIDRDRSESRACNVVADIPAPGGSGLVVVMTPKSGWFQCAAERGGGIAIAMTLAERVASMAGRRRHVRMLFTSGHELGHLGLLAYLEQNPEVRAQADFWLQLGASIGARNATGMRVFTRDAGLREWFPAQLRREGIEGVTLADAGLRPHGESREVFDRPFLSMAGRHPYFHSPQDEPQRCSDPDSVARHGRAFAALLERLLA